MCLLGRLLDRHATSVCPLLARAGDFTFNPNLRRARMLMIFENVLPLQIGIEACSTCHCRTGKTAKREHDLLPTFPADV